MGNFRSPKWGILIPLDRAGDDIWSGHKEWHRIAIECLGKYLDHSPAQQKPQAGKTDVEKGAGDPQTHGADSRAPTRKKWHADFLEAAGFEVESLRYPTEFVWPVDEVAGYMYSIAGRIPQQLGDRREAFERDFCEALTRLDPSGVMRDTINFFLLIATKPSEE